MSVFKLVLCLTGLAIYLVVKQFVVNRSNVLPTDPARHSSSPQPVQGEGSPQKRTLKPQTTPHTEVLKSSQEWV
jgi:hypothetical protein